MSATGDHVAEVGGTPVHPFGPTGHDDNGVAKRETNWATLWIAAKTDDGMGHNLTRVIVRFDWRIVARQPHLRLGVIAHLINYSLLIPRSKNQSVECQQRTPTRHLLFAECSPV